MSFRLKTILGIALIEASLLAVLILSGLWYITNSTQREFLQRVESTVDAFAVTTKDAVLSTDIASLESFVKEVLTYPGVRYARILDAEGRVLASAGESSLLERPFKLDESFEKVDDGILDTRALIEEVGYLFGEVQIGITVDELQQLIQKARQYGISIGVVEMLLVALFSFILGGYLTRQLAGLTVASQQIAAGNLGYQLEVRGSDELAQTAQAFNTMSLEMASAYAQIQQRETFWHQTLNSTLDAIVVIDKQGIVLSFNAGAELMLGYHAEEVVSQNVSMLVPAPYQQAHDGYLRHYLETGEAGIIGKSRDFEIIRKDGKKLPINLRVTEMETGGDPMFIGVIHDISERKEYERELTQSLEEKKTLLKEIHHRVKNNLMVVSSILEMQEDGDGDSELNRSLRVCQDRIGSMALIHEKLYQSTTLAEVDFASYLDELIDRLMATYHADSGKIHVIKDLTSAHLNVETATPLGLIVNELVANCLKHAFIEGAPGEIHIFCDQAEDGLLTLCVSDNGCGLPENFNLEQVESLGLQLVSLLSGQLDANIRIDQDNGTRICLTLNELKYQNRM